MFANQFNNLAGSGANHFLRGNVSVRHPAVPAVGLQALAGFMAAQTRCRRPLDRYFQAKCRRPSSRPYGPRTKKLKLEEQTTGDVSPQSAEPTNTAESDSDTE